MVVLSVLVVAAISGVLLYLLETEPRPRRGLVTVVEISPVAVPYPVSAEHPPADYDG